MANLKDTVVLGNLTVTGTMMGDIKLPSGQQVISGSGVSGRITKWTGTSTLGSTGIEIDANNNVYMPGSLRVGNILSNVNIQITSGSGYDVIINNRSWKEVCDDLDALKNAVCLREGTQILMADGSSKNIEDIKKGDMIMSYDPQTKTFFPSKAFGKVYTGRDTTWTVFYFDNGAHLDIATNHPIYSPLVGLPYYSWLWKVGYEAISSEGSIIHYAYSRKVVKTTIPYKRYQVYCDSGLYFANGVLCGHLAADPVKIYYRTDGHAIELTDEEVAFYTELAKEVDDSPNTKYGSEEYLKEVMPIELQKSLATERVEDYKKELANRDYKTIKAFQGLVTDEENAQNIAECEEYRAKIAVEEETIKNCDSQIAAIDEKYDATCEDKYDIWRRQFRTVVEISKERHKDWSSESSCGGCSDESGDN